MKTIYTLVLLSLFISCKETSKDISENETKESTISKAENATKKETSKQQGNYTALFEREAGNCDFITTEGLAKALGVFSHVITNESNDCSYRITKANGASASFRFAVQPWSNKQILKEIKTAKENAETFGKDSKLSQYRISETGDTYLSMHQNRMVRILNEKANNAIIIFYNATISSEEKDIEQKKSLKDTALEHAYTIANYLLNTHKQ